MNDCHRTSPQDSAKILLLISRDRPGEIWSNASLESSPVNNCLVMLCDSVRYRVDDSGRKTVVGQGPATSVYFDPFFANFIFDQLICIKRDGKPFTFGARKLHALNVSEFGDC